METDGFKLAFKELAFPHPLSRHAEDNHHGRKTGDCGGGMELHFHCSVPKKRQTMSCDVVWFSLSLETKHSILLSLSSAEGKADNTSLCDLVQPSFH